MRARAIAVRVLCQVIVNRRSLDKTLSLLSEPLSDRDRAFVRYLCFGVIRRYLYLSALVVQALEKPFKHKDQDLKIIICLGVFQLLRAEVADYAAIHSSVELVKWRKKLWAVNVVNGVLRHVSRHLPVLKQQIPDRSAIAYGLPAWLYQRIQRAWPKHWPVICAASLQQAPMDIRVNQQQLSREDYETYLTERTITSDRLTGSPMGLRLRQAVPSHTLPGFQTGWVSVQSYGAQLATLCLQSGLQMQARVLDACSAPGGKATHLLECVPDVKLVAIEKAADRIPSAQAWVRCLQLQLAVTEADATQVSSWWDGELFDAILIDAPCSATGVLARHPDIKLLRRPEDVTAVSKQQQRLLQTLWPLLKPGGRLLYVTCSLLPEENQQQIHYLMATHADCVPVPFEIPDAEPCDVGWQRLPGVADSDGFYYALVTKVAV